MSRFLEARYRGLGVGLLALQWPQVLGGGYGWMQQAIDGKLAFALLISLLFVKMVAFALTISSGGSGGVFAPTLFGGAMLGGFLAAPCHQPSAAFVVVGMAAVFGAAARVPVAALLMVTEMTGGFHCSLLPDWPSCSHFWCKEVWRPALNTAAFTKLKSLTASSRLPIIRSFCEQLSI
ncbi:MAG: chloride channel protein [Acidobacteriaceae bacterium]|nr:chloride channel protein [Acidobacteriaceae bacterium]